MTTETLSQLVVAGADPVAELTRLTALTVKQTSAKSWTYSDIGVALGAPIRTALIGFIVAAQVAFPDLAAAHLALATTGLTLDGDDKQTMVTAILADDRTPVEIKPVIEAVGKLGVWYVPILAEAPTLDEVTLAIAYKAKRAALDAINDQIRALIQPMFESRDAAISTLDAAATVEAINAVVVPTIG